MEHPVWMAATYLPPDAGIIQIPVSGHHTGHSVQAPKG